MILGESKEGNLHEYPTHDKQIFLNAAKSVPDISCINSYSNFGLHYK